MTYYVDATSGSNAANGTTSGTPWQTLAKVSGSTFLPGDTIYFKRGETWLERLDLPSSGSSGNPITCTVYGAGALPIFKADISGGRDEAIRLVAGRTYNAISFIHCKGGDTYIDHSSALVESDSITNIIADCTIDAQHVTDSCIGGPSTVQRTSILNADDDGFTMHGNQSGLVEGCTFSGNRTAINLSNASNEILTLTVNDSIFEENGDGLSGSFGDVGPLSYGTFTLNRCDLRGRADGGPLGFYTGSAGANTTFNYCKFNNSRSTSALNGEISVPTGETLTLRNCIFIGGAAANRGKITANAGTLNAINCIFFNVAQLKGVGGGQVNLTDCIVYNTSGIPSTSNHLYNSTRVSNSDPLFTNVATGDFTLQSGSPARDTGSSLGMTSDIRGYTVTGTPDIGAYEYGATAPGASITATSATFGTLTIG